MSKNDLVEAAILLLTPLYVMGQARERQDIVAAEIGSDPKCPMFLISCRTEQQLTRGLGVSYWIWGILGLVLAVAGVAVFTSAHGGGLPRAVTPGVAAASVYLLAWALGWVWLVFNSLIGLRNRVSQAWSLVEVETSIRSDSESHLGCQRTERPRTRRADGTGLAAHANGSHAAGGGRAGLKPQPLMAANDFERAVVPVDLAQ